MTATQTFLAIGECMVEFAPTGANAYAMGFAGDTLNTAWYARRHLPKDWRVAYLTAVGTDTVSDDMIAFAQAAGLDTGAIERMADRTLGLYVIRVKNGERSFSYWRDSSAARLLAHDPDRLAAAMRDAAVIYVSGITVAIVQGEGRQNLLDALTAARRAGARVVFDSNLRPRLWSDVATMRAVVSQTAALADIVLPSFDDEAAHFGDASPEATAARYADLGAPLVVVKNGPGPVLTRDAAGTVALHPTALVARVVDTTAAGDSFNAGFLASHLAGDPLADAVRAGSRLAARVVGKPGALVETD